MGRQRNNPKWKERRKPQKQWQMKYKQVNHQILSSKNWLSGSSMIWHRITKNYRETTMNTLQTISTWKKEIETINKGQEEMKNTISELKKEHSRRNQKQTWWSRGSDQRAGEQGWKNTQNEQEKKKRLRKNEQGLREIQDNTKHNIICIIGYQKEKKSKG